MVEAFVLGTWRVKRESSVIVMSNEVLDGERGFILVGSLVPGQAPRSRDRSFRGKARPPRKSSG